MNEDLQDRPLGRDLKPLRQLFSFVMPYKRMLVAALAALLLAAAATLSLPVAVRYMIDGGFSDSGIADRYFVILLAIAVFMAIATSVRFYLVSWLGERVVTDVRAAVYANVVRLDPVFFETTRTGEVQSRLTTDTTLVQTVIGSSASMALRSAVMMLGALIMLIVTAPKLAMIILLLIPVVVLPIVGYARQVRGLSRASQDRIADASARAGETLGAMQTVQAFTQENGESRRFGESVEAAFVAAMRHAKARSILAAMSILLTFAGIVTVMWMGARAVISGTMTAGELGQFVLYAATMASGTAVLSGVWGDLQRAAGATERLVELLNAKPDIRAPDDPIALPEPPRGIVSFNHVSFSYPSRPDTNALDRFTLRVAKGETVALVGPSGAGKSTVFQLLLRFYDPQRGHVAVDGVDIRQTDPITLRQRIGIVPQDTFIFAANAMENIRYGKPDATDDQVRAAAHAALADEFLNALPDGFDSYLGEKGIRLSGGQRQRIAIARAILKDPPVLLLDEATSSLDAASERIVQEALGHLVRDRTTLVIAHRFATVLRADRIIVMEDGQIVDEGTHDELQRRDGLYARLAALQFTDNAA